jgi:ubiquinone/menaquinone biosynthesis C-methylase UbiE
MLMHLDDHETALAEMVRVVRPGGKVVVFDFDWDAVFVDSPYKETTRKIVHAFSDGHLAKAQQAGVLSADALASWWKHLEQAEAAGQFHLGILGFIVGGRKPS